MLTVTGHISREASTVITKAVLISNRSRTVQKLDVQILELTINIYSVTLSGTVWKMFRLIAFVI